MTGLPAMRVSDGERDEIVAVLRDHMAAGRLTLEEFTERMSAAQLARTADQLRELTRDLPVSAAVETRSRRRPTHFLLSIFSSIVRDGRARLGRRVVCLATFGSIDLDLRQATLDTEAITIFALGTFAQVSIYVPEGVEVDLQGLVVFGHKNTRGNDPLPQPGTPIVRVYSLSVFGGVDVWRVPRAWSQESRFAVRAGIRLGAHRKLEA
jgi:hypothetical protein